VGVELQDGQARIPARMRLDRPHADRMLPSYDPGKAVVCQVALHPLPDGRDHLLRGKFNRHRLVREDALPVNLGIGLDIVQLHVGRGSEDGVGNRHQNDPRARRVAGFRW
jgi:hypothetical protein